MQEISKTRTGIAGLDEITFGGLPANRPTLVCGSAGCGKTLLGLEFLLRGILQFDEPGVFMSFEENTAELAANVSSLGFDLENFIEQGKLSVDHVILQKADIEESGDYDLEGLFLRLNFAIESVGAKRVVIDTIETLFSALSDMSVLRAELVRLFRWLKDRGVTTIVTGERGAGALTRNGLEEYVSDCVILLDHRVQDRISTRWLRVVKYRGTHHGTNEYPFLIDEQGISVLPVTSLSLDHAVYDDRISSGIDALDVMLGGIGYFRGTSILVTGTAGSGKTSVVSHAADAACRRGEKCIFFAFEESPLQIMRNLRSIGIDLQQWVDQGLLQFFAVRPQFHGLEMHLLRMHREIEQANPTLVIVDPMSAMSGSGLLADANIALLRLMDFLKARGVTGLFTILYHGDDHNTTSDMGLSSMMDSWLGLHLRDQDGQRQRYMTIYKSRGAAHSNKVHQYKITGQGIKILLDDSQIQGKPA